MKLEREILQKNGIPHLPGNWEYRNEDQQMRWLAENYYDIFKEMKFKEYCEQQLQKIRLNDTEAIDKYSELFDEGLNEVSDEDLLDQIENYHIIRNEVQDIIFLEMRFRTS